ncbi:glycoside hydrolase family 30 protein [Alkalibacterium sp. f15]|uniref:glycoside hydrolase family 30 protein n=1 Tax=Alkalibacterium sp. f15 TaxID=3414029 RepID=UPI003BF81649
MIKVFESIGAQRLFEETDFIDSKNAPSETIEVNTAEEFQEIDGFGASFTDSSAFLIDKQLSEIDKKNVMEKLFDRKKGIGLTMLRNPMGSSDYARFIYSYDDQKEREKDLELKDFSITHDKESIIPLTLKAMELNPDVKLIASPWSAPGWMKDTYTMVKGKLRKEYYSIYADYFVRFIKAYGQEGIDVYAVTPQNEPLFEPSNYPGMKMLSDEQAIFVKDYLKPAFVREKLDTKIFGYDHNWDRVDYAFDILDYARDSFDGIAWHWYGGRTISQSRVKDAYPHSEVHFTEGSGGNWIPEFEPAFSNVMRTGIEVMRNHSKSFILWNMALDENNGPVVPGFGNSTCRGLVKINQKEKSFEFTLDYYALAHFSKFVKIGAKRIHSSQKSVIKNVVFKNVDNSIVIVLFNDSEEDRVTEINLNNSNSFTMDIKAKAAMTIVI